MQIAITPALVDKMVEALSWQSQQPQWLKDGGQFIPHPATYLRARGWEDEKPKAEGPRMVRVGAFTIPQAAK